jgi:hypothetical protein
VSNVDLSTQKSVSITGETITPSGFNIFEHSLKNTFDSIVDRIKEQLPGVDPLNPDEEEGDDTEDYSKKIIDFSGLGIERMSEMPQAFFDSENYEFGKKYCASTEPTSGFDLMAA